jgi:hypothetical protein
MTRWLTRSSAVVAAAAAVVGTLAVEASAGATELICLNARGQFVTCTAGTVPAIPYTVSPPSFRPPALPVPRSRAGPSTTDAVLPLVPVKTAPVARPTIGLSESKHPGNPLPPLSLTLAFVILLAASGGLMLQMRARRRRAPHAAHTPERVATTGDFLESAISGPNPANRRDPLPSRSDAPPAASIIGVAENNSQEQRDDRPFPIGNYSELRASQIVFLLSDLDADQLAQVRERESTEKGRVSILRRIDLLLGPVPRQGQTPQPPHSAFPIPYYERLRASDIVARLSTLTLDQLGEVEQRERDQGGRATVLRRIARLRSASATAGAPDSLADTGTTPEGTAVPPVSTGPDMSSTPATVGGNTAVSVTDARHLVDDAFGDGTFGRLSTAASRDVAARLDENQPIDAVFSAAHYLALGHAPEWSRQNHQRMGEAERAATDDDRRNGQMRKAGSRCAYLRLLHCGLPPEVDVYASAIRLDLQDRLARYQLDVRTAGSATDLFLVSGEWIPDDDQTRRLIQTVQSDASDRLRSGDDEVFVAARVALWFVATTAAHGKFDKF